MTWRSFSVLYAVLAVAGSLCAGCLANRAELRRLSEPVPIDDPQQVARFYVVVREANRGARLVDHAEEIRRDWTPGKTVPAVALERLDLEPARLGEVFVACRSKLDPLQAAEIEVIGPATGEQGAVIRVRLFDDDFTWVSAYRPTDQGFVPVEYGDQTKRDGVMAFEAGLGPFRWVGAAAAALYGLLWMARRLRKP